MSVNNPTSSSSSSVTGAPILRLIVGLGCVLAFLVAVMLSIQASEAFILNGAATTLTSAVNWRVWTQIPDMLGGKYNLEMSKAIFYAWTVELIYLACVIGEVTLGGRWHGWFKTGALIIVAYDFLSNFQYGQLGPGIGGQLAFAGITAFAIGFLGWLGIDLIWKSVHALK